MSAVPYLKLYLDSEMAILEERSRELVGATG